MSLDTELRLSPKLAAISFLDGRFVPGGTGVDSTLLIGKPITIPLSDVSPELKAILVQGMIKGGRAKVVKGKVKGKVK